MWKIVDEAKMARWGTTGSMGSSSSEYECSPDESYESEQGSLDEDVPAMS